LVRGAGVAAQLYLLPQGLVGSLRCLIINNDVEGSQLLFATFGGRMRHGKYLTIGVIVLAAFAAQAIVAQAIVTQAIAAPKRATAKKPPPPPVPETIDPAQLPFMSTFIDYDVGTLRMTGKKATDMTYSVGTLQLNGRAGAATIYNVGTLSMTGKLEP
jgi:hypothetical protein